MKNNGKDNIEYSVVVPVLNEEENVHKLYDEIVKVMSSMARPYEIIFVDDGSTDRTFDILKSINAEDRRLKVIKFRDNFGQSAAMGAGFEYASGKVIISMDGDLQNDPQNIPDLIAKLDEGYDVVSGWRKQRKDKLIIRKVPSMIANRLIRFSTQVPLHDTGCSLKVYRSDVVKRINLYGEMHRFIPALARIEGARIGEIVVNHRPRMFGESKYNIMRTFKVIMDLMTLNLFLKYLMKPIHFFGTLGTLFNFVGVLFLLSMVYCVGMLGFCLEDINVLLSTTFLYVAAGFQLLFFGLIASMVVSSGDRVNVQLYDKYPE